MCRDVSVSWLHLRSKRAKRDGDNNYSATVTMPVELMHFVVEREQKETKGIVHFWNHIIAPSAANRGGIH